MKKQLLFLTAAVLATAPLFAEETPGDLFTAQCEHDIPHYTCEECRYELGLVKLDPSLIRSEEKADGLIAFETVTKRPAQTVLPLSGEIALNANTLAHITPRVSGIVKTVRADLGREVKAGDVLFEIESPELGRAVGVYRKNRALAALALKNLEREQALVEKKISPEADLIEARMKYDEYRIELEAAANGLTVMGLDAAAVEDLASDARAGTVGTIPVRAPQSGTVIALHLVPGEIVESGRDAMTVADLSTVWVWLSLYECDLAQFLGETEKGATRVRLSVAAFPATTFEGVFDFLGALVDEEERTIKVRASLENPKGLLRPGMFCTADAVFKTDERVTAVPKAALMTDEGVSFVFRQVRDGYVLRTDVKAGRVFADSVEILGGLAEGERIVTEGAFVCKSDVLRAKMGAGCAD
ncbi:MAG: efflux RND transporter periplasmic adaptor subunit [Verrucomicrobiota bacterium]|jgi:cobalt-zinc-cadmium efflux system membrane fusion protein|nr:efflux RND transporter periplasmic adaptor subunit [Verrucomicrobiota bacterium]